MGVYPVQEGTLFLSLTAFSLEGEGVLGPWALWEVLGAGQPQPQPATANAVLLLTAGSRLLLGREHRQEGLLLELPK